MSLGASADKSHPASFGLDEVAVFSLQPRLAKILATRPQATAAAVRGDN
jgi:hypothetical protein